MFRLSADFWPTVLPFLLGGLILIFVLFSLVFFYHWRRYGRGDLVVGIMESIYLAGSILLFIFMYKSLFS